MSQAQLSLPNTVIIEAVQGSGVVVAVVGHGVNLHGGKSPFDFRGVLPSVDDTSITDNVGCVKYFFKKI